MVPCLRFVSGQVCRPAAICGQPDGQGVDSEPASETARQSVNQDGEYGYSGDEEDSGIEPKFRDRGIDVIAERADAQNAEDRAFSEDDFPAIEHEGEKLAVQSWRGLIKIKIRRFRRITAKSHLVRL